MNMAMQRYSLEVAFRRLPTIPPVLLFYFFHFFFTLVSLLPLGCSSDRSSSRFSPSSEEKNRDAWFMRHFSNYQVEILSLALFASGRDDSFPSELHFLTAGHLTNRLRNAFRLSILTDRRPNVLAVLVLDFC